MTPTSPTILQTPTPPPSKAPRKTSPSPAERQARVLFNHIQSGLTDPQQLAGTMNLSLGQVDHLLSLPQTAHLHELRRVLMNLQLHLMGLKACPDAFGRLVELTHSHRPEVARRACERILQLAHVHGDTPSWMDEPEAKAKTPEALRGPEKSMVEFAAWLESLSVPATPMPPLSNTYPIPSQAETSANANATGTSAPSNMPTAALSNSTTPANVSSASTGFTSTAASVAAAVPSRWKHALGLFLAAALGTAVTTAVTPRENVWESTHPSGFSAEANGLAVMDAGADSPWVATRHAAETASMIRNGEVQAGDLRTVRTGQGVRASTTGYPPGALGDVRGALGPERWAVGGRAGSAAKSDGDGGFSRPRAAILVANFHERPRTPMHDTTALIESDIHAYLDRHQKKELLRFLTCGSVDDGKSTLIGRLLHDTQMIYEDQLAAIKRDTVKHGTTGGEIDLALLTDGLKAEREQGITIDVAYRYFSTDKRKFIIADTPGHEQYTRNMATGASTCHLAIILIDARHGVMPQTKRHSFIVSLLGIQHVVVAINKMDLVGFSQETYEQIKSDYTDFVAKLGIRDVQFIPMSALKGDNVVDRSAAMPWYQGPPLLSHLETVHIASDRNLADFRFPVQFVLRPNLDFRGFAGTIASGIVRVGDEVMALPSGKKSKVQSIVIHGKELQEAFSPMAVTLTLEDEIDVSRGDMLVHPSNVPHLASEVEAMVVWMHEKPLQVGRTYSIKQTTKLLAGEFSGIRFGVDVNTLERREAGQLGLNEVGRVRLTLNQPLAFDAYQRNPASGAFIIIDRLSNTTVGAGMILEPDDLHHSGDHWSGQVASTPSVHTQISPSDRQQRYGQKPVTVLFTGLVGSGKATLAYALEKRLFELGRAVTVLHGQAMRQGLTKDLGYSADDRSENLRRSAEVAKLMNDAGLIVLGAFLAPHAAVRQKVKQLLGAERFVEVHLSAPIEVCKTRDAKGMYALAEAGKITAFPGISAAYEAPTNPDLVLPTHELSVEECVDRLVALLKQRGVIA